MHDRASAQTSRPSVSGTMWVTFGVGYGLRHDQGASTQSKAVARSVAYVDDRVVFGIEPTLFIFTRLRYAT